MRFHNAIGLVVLNFIMACAPAQQPSNTSAAKPTVAPAEIGSQRALEKAPLRKGETWTLTVTSADNKNKRTYNIEITGTLEYDDKTIEVYALAKSGNLAVTTFYDPDTQQQGIAVYLDKNSDPKVAWCDFNEATRGVTKMIGVSFTGTISQLNRLLKASSNTGFGKCSFEKIR